MKNGPIHIDGSTHFLTLMNILFPELLNNGYYENWKNKDGITVTVHKNKKIVFKQYGTFIVMAFMPSRSLLKTKYHFMLYM